MGLPHILKDRHMCKCWLGRFTVARTYTFTVYLKTFYSSFFPSLPIFPLSGYQEIDLTICKVFSSITSASQIKRESQS